MKPSLSALETGHREELAGPPIFVVGSARSGTTLLDHMLLSRAAYSRGSLANQPFLFCLFPGSAT